VTWDEIAEKEVRDAIRSRGLWGLCIAFTLLFALPVVFAALVSADVFGSTNDFVTTMRQAISFLIPIIAIFVGYATVSGERTTGSLKVLLSFPHARHEVVVGKAVGRSAVVAGPILIALGVVAALLLSAGASLEARPFLVFAAATVWLGAVFVAIAVGLSAATTSSRRAGAGAVGLYVTGAVFWDFLTNVVTNEAFQRTALEGDGARLGTQLALKLLNPTQAYNALVAGATSDVPAAYTLFGTGLLGGGRRQLAIEALGSTPPAYFRTPVIAVVLLLWAVVPVALGALLFDATDL
jgi:ABC-2 type transport system permease protein